MNIDAPGPAARLLAVRRACQIPVEARTERDVDDVLDFVKDVKVFAKLPKAQQRGLCKVMSLEEFDAGENVFEIGDAGDIFYIILTGNIGVQLPEGHCPKQIHPRNACDCLEGEVLPLGSGDSFGEKALEEETPRTCTTKALERTELLLTRRADYNSFAESIHGRSIEQRVQFLRQCPRIMDSLRNDVITAQDIVAIADCLSEVSLGANALICRQGDPVDRVIFVRSGQLLALRTVDLEAAAGAALTSSSAGGSGKMRRRSWASGRRRTQRTSLGTSSTEAENAGLAKTMELIRERERKAKVEATTTDAAGNRVPANTQQEATPDKDSLGMSGGRLRWRDVGRTSRQAFAIKSLMKPAPPEAAAETAATSSTAAATSASAPTSQSRSAPEAMASHLAEAIKNIEHFESVQRARRRMASEEVKRLLEKKNVPEPTRSPGQTASLDTTIRPPPRQRKLLRVGTYGPFEYYGEKQLITGEVFKVSLVTDPVAEVYIMNRQDVQRRLPKKLLAALAAPGKEDSMPSDEHLLQLNEASMRWDAFRRSMHAEALCQRRGSCMSAGQIVRGDSNQRSRVDAAGNLEFLGVSATSALAQAALLPPRPSRVVLTSREHEHFGDATARFLRRYHAVRLDPAVSGLKRGSLSARNARSMAEDLEKGDPMTLQFERQWSRIGIAALDVDLENLRSGSGGRGGSPGATDSRVHRLTQRMQAAKEASAGANPNPNRPHRISYLAMTAAGFNRQVSIGTAGQTSGFGRQTSCFSRQASPTAGVSGRMGSFCRQASPGPRLPGQMGSFCRQASPCKVQQTSGVSRPVSISRHISPPDRAGVGSPRSVSIEEAFT
eukprot:CAMPEP_0170573176 /NCGR_PEP_ID=MMETSP0224-20130122/2625_1 /TAXON_ID=285029 /ORGANISM="Togula jolla, Strain CCCM 725" /LENGTH=837 /DNA_ID=CAMNT_0010895745 /DNA_START=1 /DNA_END=2514 /DNA_ORIENTATION=+